MLQDVDGVGLRFVRDLEQGKDSLRLDKVNQLLDSFNYEMIAVPKVRIQNADQDRCSEQQRQQIRCTYEPKMPLSQYFPGNPAAVEHTECMAMKISGGNVGGNA